MDAGSLAIVATGVALSAGLAGAWVIVASGARLEAVARYSGDERADPADERERRRRQADGLLLRTGFGRRLAQQVRASGISLRPFEFVLIAAAVTLLAFVVANALFPALMALLLAAGAARACWGWLELKRSKRREEFVGQLPELARLLSNGTSAGLSMVGALEMTAAEIGEPARSELQLALEEMRIGQSLEMALERLAERMPSRELGVLVGTLVIQQRSGGDVVRALSGMSQALDERKDLRREVKTLMSGSVYTGYIVAGIGVATLFLLNTINPAVFDDLTSSVLGVLALIVAAGLYGVGLVLMRRATRIDV